MDRRISIPLGTFALSFAAAWLAFPATRPAAGEAGPVIAARTPAPQPLGPILVDRAKINSAMAPVRAAKDRWSAIQATIQLARSIPAEDQQTWLTGGWFTHGDPLLVQIFRHELGEVIYLRDPYLLVSIELESKAYRSSSHLPQLAKDDLEGLIVFGKTTDDVARKNQILWEAVAALVDRDPGAAMKLALELSPEAAQQHNPALLLGKAAGGDTAKLLAMSDQTSDRWRPVLRAAALETMIAKDPAAALRWMLGEEDKVELYKLSFSGLGLMEEQAIERNRQFADHLDRLPPDFTRDLVQTGQMMWPTSVTMKGAEENWLRADLDRMGFEDPVKRRVRSFAIGELLRRDPVQGAKLLADDSIFSEEERSQAVRLWASMDANGFRNFPDSAIANLDEATANFIRNRQANPKPALRPLKQPEPIPTQFEKPSPYSTSPSLNFTTWDWTPSQVDEAKKYIRSRNAGQIRDMVVALTGTSEVSSTVVGEIYSKALAENVTAPGLLKDIAERSATWAQREPLKAAAWAARLPAGEARTLAIRNIAAQWDMRQPAEAEQWIKSLKDQGEQQLAREAIATAKRKPSSPDDE